MVSVHVAACMQTASAVSVPAAAFHLAAEQEVGVVRTQPQDSRSTHPSASSLSIGLDPSDGPSFSGTGNIRPFVAAAETLRHHLHQRRLSSSNDVHLGDAGAIVGVDYGTSGIPLRFRHHH